MIIRFDIDVIINVIRRKLSLSVGRRDDCAGIPTRSSVIWPLCSVVAGWLYETLAAGVFVIVSSRARPGIRYVVRLALAL
jgi:hypothetical protein